MFTTDGRIVASSGDELERITAGAVPALFNSDHGVSSFAERQDPTGSAVSGDMRGKVSIEAYPEDRAARARLAPSSRESTPELGPWVNENSP